MLVTRGRGELSWLVFAVLAACGGRVDSGQAGEEGGAGSPSGSATDAGAAIPATPGATTSAGSPEQPEAPAAAGGPRLPGSGGAASAGAAGKPGRGGSAGNGGARADGGARNGGAATDGSASSGGAPADGSASNGGAATDGGASNGGARADGGASNGGAATDGAASAGGASAGEQVGVTVSTTSLYLREGDPAEFYVALTARPQSEVTIGISNPDPQQLSVGPLELKFDASNWHVPQRVAVAGVEDVVAEGTLFYLMKIVPAMSADARYAGLDPSDVAVTLIDDDDSGITVGSAQGNTTESGGTATFWVALNSQPTARVILPLRSSDLSEGVVQNEVTIDPVDWNKPHNVTITGVDDELPDGNRPYQIIFGPAVSNDVKYAGIQPQAVRLINVDNE